MSKILQPFGIPVRTIKIQYDQKNNVKIEANDRGKAMHPLQMCALLNQICALTLSQGLNVIQKQSGMDDSQTEIVETEKNDNGKTN